MIPDAGRVEVEADGRRVALTSLEKPIWPDGSMTKGDVVRWYAAVAAVLLPHVRGRPLTLWRWPDGVQGRGFEQMECRGAPSWLRVASLTLKSGRVRGYCMVDDLAGLLWMANLTTLEVHPYPTRPDRHDVPAMLLFDLDPRPPAGLRDACGVALRIADVLAAAGLLAWVKTSGGAGLHVAAPLAPGHTFAETRATARWVAEGLAAETPDAVSASTRPDERAGRVFVDWMQNDARRSTIAPYSLRVTPAGITASTPVAWEEVRTAAASGDATALHFARADVLERIARLGDLYGPVATVEQRLPDRPGGS